jgi:hypothetical protein
MDNDASTDASAAADDLVTGPPSTTDAEVPADTDARHRRDGDPDTDTRPLPDDEQDTDTPDTDQATPPPYGT